MTRARIATLLLLASALPAQIPSIASSPTVKTVPGKVLVERGKSQWHLNFDFRITNPGTTAALLDHIGLRVFDSQGALVQRKYVDRGGTGGVSLRIFTIGGSTIVRALPDTVQLLVSVTAMSYTPGPRPVILPVLYGKVLPLSIEYSKVGVPPLAFTVIVPSFN